MRAYTIRNQNTLYFLTWTIVGWIDVFTRQRYRDIMIESFKYCVEHKGLILYAYVIMSNHIHLIASADQDYNLSDIIRDCKKFTSKQLIQSIQELPESRRDWMLNYFRSQGLANPNNKSYQIWQQDNRAIELSDLRRCYQKLAYIHQNPVKAGIVTEPEHYLYSSARNYARLPALMDVTLIEIVPLDGYMRPLAWGDER